MNPCVEYSLRIPEQFGATNRSRDNLDVFGPGQERGGHEKIGRNRVYQTRGKQ